MEQPSTFSMQVTEASKNALLQTAKWGKFLSVVGFVMCGMCVLFAIFFSFFMSGLMEAQGMGSLFGGAYLILYLLFAVLYFFPCLYLFRFSVKAKDALTINDSNILSDSFNNLRMAFQFVGILTIVMLALYALILFVVLVALTFR